jgi:peptide/nickel transport system substrate-binding protein
MSSFKTMNLIKYALLIATYVWMFTSCKKPQTKTLVVHILHEPEDLHPTNGTSALRAEINLYTQLSLLKIDYKTSELLPCIAKALPIVSEDGLKYTYEIKDELAWDDKTPITAADVAFTTKANKCLLTNNPALKQNWDNVKDIVVDAKNSKKFTVVMNHPNALNTWFWTDFPIIEESFFDKQKALSACTTAQLIDSIFLKTNLSVKAWADEFNSPKYYSNPEFMNGGGPYKVTKWDKGVSITLEKKKDHWAKNCEDYWFCQANADKIILKLNTNNASTLLELKNGLMDVSTNVDYASFSELVADKVFTDKYITKLADTYNYTYIAMNMKPDGKTHEPIFTDVLVRRAMAMLVPYNQINKLVYGNHCKRMVSPVSPLKKEFNAELKPIEYNVQQAQALLKQAGWEDTDDDQILDKVIDGKKVKFQFSINFINAQKQWEDIAKQIAESMQKANIFVQLNPLEFNGFVSAAMNHDFDMSMSAWQSSVQPEDFSQLWKTVSWSTNGFNFTGFGNTRSDALIDSINSCVQESKRVELTKQFQQLVYQEQPYIFLLTQARRVVVSKKWTNLEIYTEYPGVLLNTLKLND